MQTPKNKFRHMSEILETSTLRFMHGAPILRIFPSCASATLVSTASILGMSQVRRLMGTSRQDVFSRMGYHFHCGQEQASRFSGSTVSSRWYCLGSVSCSYNDEDICRAKNESSRACASQFLVDASFRATALNNYDGDMERPDYNKPCFYCERDGFYYDVIKLRRDPRLHSLAAPTLVGLLPLVAIETLETEKTGLLPSFCPLPRTNSIGNHRSVLGTHFPATGVLRDDDRASEHGKKKLGIYAVNKEQLRRILKKLLDPNEFLSPFGIRSASKALEKRPFRFDAGEGEKELRYIAAESYGDGKLFAGNSNWRGSIWMPTTYAIIESLFKYHSVLGDEFLVECPTGSGSYVNLREVALEIASRLSLLFKKQSNGVRPSQGLSRYDGNPKWDRLLFFEYFDGDNGAGYGASHQTG